MNTLPRTVKRRCPLCGRVITIRNMDGKMREHKTKKNGEDCPGGSPPLHLRKGR